jgi:phosphate transport system substrate-binding protein
MRTGSAVLLAGLVVGACGGGESADPAIVTIDGSSTVFPITEAVAEEFQGQYPDVRVTVGISGTGGGFKKFTVGETDINDASRLIKGSEESLAEENGIGFIELPVAFDGLSVVVNPSNTFVDYLTVEELRRIWEPGSAVTRTDSGTFDYFTEAINGEGGAVRQDFTASEDDNVLVQGVAGDPNALAFFGYAYYSENTDQLKVVPVDPGDGAVAPSEQTINDGSYRPLSRPIFIYVSTVAAERPEVQAFVRFYLENAASLAGEVGYVALPTDAYQAGIRRFEARATGSVFSGDTKGKSIAEILRTE